MSPRNPWKIIEERTEYTPDWFKLCESTQSKFLVFIHGNLKKGHRFGSFLNECDYYGQAITFGSNYFLKRYSYEWDGKTVEAEPILLETPPNRGDSFWGKTNHLSYDRSFKIVGDIYALTPRYIAEIDEHMENTMGTSRVQRFITMMDQPKMERSRQAWMYVSSMEDYLEFANSENDRIFDCSVCQKPEFGQYYIY